MKEPSPFLPFLPDFSSFSRFFPLFPLFPSLSLFFPPFFPVLGISSVARPLCQEVQSERTFSIFAFPDFSSFSRFSPIFPSLSLFVPLFPDFWQIFAVTGHPASPLPPGYATARYEFKSKYSRSSRHCKNNLYFNIYDNLPAMAVIPVPYLH